MDWRKEGGYRGCWVGGWRWGWEGFEVVEVALGVAQEGRAFVRD